MLYIIWHSYKQTLRTFVIRLGYSISSSGEGHRMSNCYQETIKKKVMKQSSDRPGPVPTQRCKQIILYYNCLYRRHSKTIVIENSMMSCIMEDLL